MGTVDVDGGAGADADYTWDGACRIFSSVAARPALSAFFRSADARPYFELPVNNTYPMTIPNVAHPAPNHAALGSASSPRSTIYSRDAWLHITAASNFIPGALRYVHSAAPSASAIDYPRQGLFAQGRAHPAACLLARVQADSDDAPVVDVISSFNAREAIPIELPRIVSGNNGVSGGGEMSGVNGRDND
ncbi:hypothetical protein B0H17DRAFT_1336958 [Mycena rosella]|uniref:Uncharacterized protein n=1 Tax=Mycena rosella TaxID=1033263 RepID=A0AAD7CUI9_MYCRO|nr:hypothetical protein B0H17DRAFT_1336958 [Mycena rosella]